MKSRPILFSGAMVRAILEGRKTQTRRIVKPQPSGEFCGWCTDSVLPREVGGAGFADPVTSRLNTIMRSPYGQPGDQLWVRETWASDDGKTFWYRADGETYNAGLPWKPSIHMRRKASRIQLEVTGVRVERLNSISEADAVAEGCGGHPVGAARGWFHDLWDKINGLESWGANPWVWVVEFRQIDRRDK